MQDHETKFSDILQNLKVLTLSDDEKMQVIQVLGFDHQYQDNGRVVIYTSIYDSANDLQPTAIYENSKDYLDWKERHSKCPIGSSGFYLGPPIPG